MQNPYEGTEDAASWRLGFVYGFTGPNYSGPPPMVIAPELIDAFNEGRLVGQECAIEGISVRIRCEDEDHAVAEAAEWTMRAGHAGHSMYELSHAKYAAGLAGIFLLVLEVAILGPKRGPRAEEVIGGLGSEISERLSEMGITDPIEVFVAVQFYQAAPACEYKFSNVFRTLDQARAAAASIRDESGPATIAVFRTDMPGEVAFYND